MWTCFSFFRREMAWDFWIIWKCIFNFVRKCQTVSQSGWTILQSHQPCKKSSSCFVSLPVVGIISFYFILPILLGVWVFFYAQWNIYKHLTMVLICISLVINGVEHPFMCLFVIIIASLMKCLRLSAVFSKLGYFLTVEFQSFLKYSG